MEVIPAIDLMKGMVVRLEKGDPKTFKSYQSLGDPLQVARKWEKEGATFLHVIDLDAAMNLGSNLETIARLIRGTRVPVQVGGGIRSKGTAEEMFKIGARRIIVATLAFERVNELLELLEDFGWDRVMVALDYLNDKVMIRGWRSSTDLTLREAISRFLKLGVRVYLLTSISKDGLLTGPDYITLKNIVDNTGAEVFAAGGIGSLEDLTKLRQTGVRGVVIGKALYENRFSLKEAINLVKD